MNRPRLEPFSLRKAWPLLLGLLIWEIAARFSLLRPEFFPPPTRILGELCHLAQEAAFYAHLLATMRRVAIGFAIGALSGAVAGIFCGRSRAAAFLLEPWIEATYPLPTVAFIPLLILLLGLGETLCLAVIALGVFYPVFINARTGVSQVDPSLLDAARNLGAAPRELVSEVMLPAMYPYLFAGAYQGLMRAILMATVIEALAAFQGIGKMLWLSGEWLRVDAYLAYLFVLATLGLGAVATLKLAAQSLAPWINEMPEPARKFDA